MPSALAIARSAPWVTAGLIAIQLVVFAFTSAASRETDRALEALVRLRAARPEARVDPSILERASEASRDALEPLVLSEARAPRPDDLALERAVNAVLDAARRSPSARFGYRTAAPSIGALVASPFVHSSPWHLAANLALLLLLGGTLERTWPRARFLVLYVAAGLGGLLAEQLLVPGSHTPVLGASGAVAGLLGALAVGRDRAAIPARILVVLFAIASLLTWILGGPEVAHAAHLGGLLTGAALAAIDRALPRPATTSRAAPTTPLPSGEGPGEGAPSRPEDMQ